MSLSRCQSKSSLNASETSNLSKNKKIKRLKSKRKIDNQKSYIAQ